MFNSTPADTFEFVDAIKCILKINFIEETEQDWKSINSDFQKNGWNYDEQKLFFAFFPQNERKPLDEKSLNKLDVEISSVMDFCVFCKNNNEPYHIYSNHTLKDDKKVVCPKLRKYTCPTCGATGDKAHTVRYCTKKPIITLEDTYKPKLFNDYNYEMIKNMHRRAVCGLRL